MISDFYTENYFYELIKKTIKIKKEEKKMKKENVMQTMGVLALIGGALQANWPIQFQAPWTLVVAYASVD